MTALRTLWTWIRDPRKGFGTRPGLYRAVMVVGVTLVVGILSGAGVGVWYLHALALQKATEDLDRIAVLSAERTSLAYSNVDRALIGIRGTLRLLPPGAADREAVRGVLKEQLSSLPNLGALFVLEPSGAARFASDNVLATRTFSGQTFLRFHAQSPVDRMYIETGAPDPVTGLRPTLFSRRMARANGTLSGVVVAVSNPSYVAALFDRLRLGGDSRIRLLTMDGRVIVTLPPSAEEQTGTGAFLAPSKSRSSSSAASDSPKGTLRPPGSGRIVSTQSISGYPFLLEVSRDRAEQLAPWRRASTLIAIWTLLAAATVVILTGLLLRQLRRRDLAEDELLASRSLLQLIFDTVPQALYVKDLKGKLLAVNERSAQIVGIPPQDLVGKTVPRVGPPGSVSDADRARIVETDAEVLATGKPVTFEIQRLAGGDVRTLRAVKAPIRDSTGAIVSMLIVADDITEERRNRRELEKSHEALQLIFDMIPYSMLLKDRSGRIAMANAAASRTHKRPPTDLIGLRTPDLVKIPAEQERIQETDEQVMRTGLAGEFEIVRQMSQGTRVFRVYKTPMRDESGEVSGVLSLSEDITDHLTAQDQLHESQSLLQLVFDTIPYHLILRGLDGRVLMVNEATAKFTGKRRDEIVGRDVSEIIAPSEEDRVRETDAQVLATGQPVEYELRRALDGRERVRRVLKVPFRDDSATIKGLLILSEDATERQLAAENLKESQALLNLIFETIPHSLILRDLEGRLLMVNSAAAKPLGVPAASLVGKRLQDFFPPEDWAPASRSDDEVLATGNAATYELQRTFDGVRRTWHVLKVPMRDASGTIRGLISLSQEITDQRAAADKLRESEDLLRLIFDTIPYELFYKDLDGRLLFVNKTMTELWQRPMDQLIGQKLHDLIVEGVTPTQQAQEIRRTDALVAQGQPIDVEAVRVMPSGSRMLRIIKRPLIDAAHHVKGILTLSEDITERRRSDEALRRSQTLLQSMFDNIPIHIFLKDRDGRLMVMNKLFADSWHSTPQALAGQKLQELSPHGKIADSERDTILDSDARVLKGETVEVEMDRTTPDGLRRLRAVKVPLRDVAGNIANILTISEDVTDKRKAEDDLRRNRALLQVVFDTIPVGVVLKDLEGRHVLVNKFVADIMRTTPEALVGKLAHENPSGDPITEEERSRILATDERAKAGEIVDFELGRMTPQGRRLLRSIKAPVRDSRGRVNGLLVVSEDITERRRAEDELRNNRALLQAVFDTIPHHLFVKDRERRFMAVNQAMASAFRKSPESLVGQFAAEPGSPSYVEATAMEDRRVLDLGQPSDRMVSRTMPDGEVHHYHLIKAPLRDDQGRVTGLVGLSEDVTTRVMAEQKRAELEAQLQQAQKMELIGRLSAGVAHDFNNLLTPILGHAELLLSEDGIPSSGRASAQVIRQATERAAELTRGLLAFGRKQVLDMRPMKVNDAVTALLPILKRLIGTNIEIRMDLNPEAAWISGDSSQIQQVLLNLAVNARDAMPNGGLIVIGTRVEVLDPRYIESYPGCPPGEYVTLFVSDSGHGMDPETLSRVFEPFFTTKDVGKGTGLGLSIVHGIVEQHGGVIRVYSAVGQGTTFRVFLPRIQVEPGLLPEAAQVETTPIPQGKERILVVDDEELIRHLVSTVLQSHGYNVTEALGPEEALGMLNGTNPPVDLLVTDLIMPGLNGLALYRRAAERLPGLRVLYVSGHPKHLLDELGYKGLGEHFLTKPFAVERLARTVRQILDE